MKCLVLSLHRSATRSTAALLRGAGLRTAHFILADMRDDYAARVAGRETDLDFVFAATEPLIAGYDAAADVPIPVLYRQLDRRYPDAKFLLVRRDPAAWLRSVRAHTAGRPLFVGEKIQYWAYLPDRPLSLADIPDRDLLAAHAAHHERVAAYFAMHPEKLLAVDLDDPSIASRIGGFLGLAGPLEFPTVRDAAAAEKKPSLWQRTVGTIRRH